LRNAALLYINGRKHEVRGPQAFWMLADYLRYECQLTGTKIVCAEGDCGACTVMRAFSIPGKTTLQFEPINSCITLVAQMDGSNLVTIEGLKQNGALAEIQTAMVKEQGGQCGYCTPGFVMALAGLFESRGASGGPLTEKKVQNALTGNLCRCTGYQPITDAALAVDPRKNEPLSKRYGLPKIKKELAKAVRESLHIEADGKIFFAPVKMKQAVAFKSKNREARLISASTDLGVQINKGKINPDSHLSLHLVAEAYGIGKQGRTVTVGARATLSELRRFSKPSFPELARYLDIFASPQIKNIATLIGNAANASPIGDTIPFLFATDAQVLIQGPRG
jgi:xanthine dehydrogenase small subunit